jgi:hypothetical protein
MKTLHTIGCSVTHGSELAGIGIMYTPASYRDKTFTHHIASALGYDNYKIWANPGASNRYISDMAIDVIGKNPTDDVFVFWSWKERIQIWQKKNKIYDDNGNFITHDRVAFQVTPGVMHTFKTDNKERALQPWTNKELEIIEYFWLNMKGEIEWYLSTLRDILLVDSYAKVTCTSVKHFMVAPFSLPHPKIKDVLRVSGSNLNQYENGSLTAESELSNIDNHTLFTSFNSMSNVFKFKDDLGLFHEVDQEIIRNWGSRTDSMTGAHWNEQGHVLAANCIIKSLKEDI